MNAALSGDEYRRHCEHLRNRLILVEEFARWGIDVDVEPEAGMFFWASLGDNLDSALVAERMLELGHLLAPAQAFLDGYPPPSSYIRINIAQTFESSMLPTLGNVLGRSDLPPEPVPAV